MQVKLLASLLSKKKLWDHYTWNLHTHSIFPAIAIIYAYDPQLPQGLTVHEKSAHLRGTALSAKTLGSILAISKTVKFANKSVE